MVWHHATDAQKLSNETFIHCTLNSKYTIEVIGRSCLNYNWASKIACISATQYVYT